MKDLNSLFKLEHFQDKHTGWNQFSNPFSKGQEKILGAVGAPIWLFSIATNWCGLGGLEGGGEGRLGSGSTRTHALEY